MSFPDPSKWTTPIDFTDLIANFKSMEQAVAAKIQSLSKAGDKSDPGTFLLVQFMMSQATQVGDAISNLMYQINSMIAKSIQNQKV